MVWKIIAGILIAASLTVFVVFEFVCPCTRAPGGSLSGELIEQPVLDWRMANEIPLCQLEVQGPIKWSVNLNCMSAADGQLYVSCSRCDGKTWSGFALKDPNGRIRLGEKLYPVILTRVTNQQVLDLAWQARAEKFGREVQKRPDHWWSFHLASPPGGIPLDG